MRDFIVQNRWPLGIALIAILVRLVYLIQFSQAPEFAVPMIDEKWHWEWAHAILSESFWGEGAYFRAPFYPYFLAFVALITNSSVFWAKLLQSLLAAGTIWFTFKLTEYLFNRSAAIIAGFMYAVYGTLVFYETMFLIPALFLFLVVWGMYRYVRYFDSDDRRTWLITGIIFGLAIIARPNILLVVPFLGLWKFYRATGVANFVKRSIPVICLVGGLLIAVAPVTVRNLIVTGDFILISSQGGINLYLGNNPQADGLTMLMPEVTLDESVSWRQFGVATKAAAEQLADKELTESEQSAFWTGKAIQFIKDNPGQFLELVWRKTVYLVSGYENSDNVNIYYQRNKSSLYSTLVWHKWIYFPFGLLLPLALAGIYLTRKQVGKLAPIYIYLVAYTPSIVLFLVTARHRLSLLPFLMILAAAGMVELWRRVDHADWKTVGIGLALFVAALFAFNRDYYDLGDSGNQFQIHFNQGIAFEQTGDLKSAAAEYHLADQEFPYSAPLINNLAYVQFRLGKLVAAENNYRRAIDTDPTYPGSYHNYGLLMVSIGIPDSAGPLFRKALLNYNPATTDSNQYVESYLGLADASERIGNTEAAETAFKSAIIYGRGRPDPIFRASSFYARQQNYNTSDSLFEKGLTLGEASAGNWFNRGLSFMRRQKATEGIDCMQRAVTADPSIFQAYFGIAAASEQLGAPADTVRYYLERCLKIKPDFRPALSMQQRLF